MKTQKDQDTAMREIAKKAILGCNSPKDILGKEGLISTITKHIIEAALDGELDHLLGYAKNDPKGNNSGNSRNGRDKKTIFVDSQEIPICPPRDRNGEFEPQLIPKGQKRFNGFDDKIIAMYAKGVGVREIKSFLEEMYNVEVSEGLISQVTDSIMEDVKAWQNRPLDDIYPIVFLDCIVVKCRQDGKVSKLSVYLALGVTMEGNKELLGIWLAKTEGAKFWLSVITELKNRGVKDIFIACVDGLKGFPEAIEAVFPETDVQLCIVHMVRNSVRFVNWKDRKELCKDLKLIYSAPTEQQAESALDAFGAKWDFKYPMISKSWRDNWENIIPFFDFPEDIRKAIYTTNAIESLNRSLRKVIKTKGSFPTESSILKIFYLALANISKNWTMPIRCWSSAIHQFSIKYGDRMPDQI